MPNRIAFWRNEPTVRFVNLESFAKGVLAFECIRNSFHLLLYIRDERVSF
jgi:hypothetical protein